MSGVNIGKLGRQNERNNNYVKLAHTSIFGLCFLSVYLMKSNCYTLIYSSLVLIDYSTNHSYSFVFLSSFLTAEIHHLFSSYSYRYLLEKILIPIIIDLLWAFPKLTVLPGKRSRFYWAIL